MGTAFKGRINNILPLPPKLLGPPANFKRFFYLISKNLMRHLYFSQLGTSQNNPNQWLEQTTQTIRQLHTSNPIQLELPIARAGWPGVLPDNPSIELIDRLQQEAQTHQHSIAALHLPVSFPAEEQLGNEISAINGWTDMACYMGIDIIRIHIRSENPMSNSNRNILREMVDYIVDMEIQVAFMNRNENSSHELQSTLEGIIKEINQHHQVGWNHRLQWPQDQGQLEQVSFESPITAISIQTSILENLPLDTINNQLTYLFPENTPHLFVEQI